MNSKRTYHHGKLRATLLEVAERLIVEKGYEVISLREIANIAGVAPSATYRHFASKQELLNACANRGFENLASLYSLAMKSEKPIDRLMGICRVYLEYAIENPKLFELMFVANETKPNALYEKRENSEQSFEIFQKAVSEAYNSKDEAEIRVRSLSVWSSLYGAALLILHGHLQLFFHQNYNTDDFINQHIKYALSEII